jgi:hypothetical protein
VDTMAGETSTATTRWQIPAAASAIVPVFCANSAHVVH